MLERGCTAMSSPRAASKPLAMPTTFFRGASWPASSGSRALTPTLILRMLPGVETISSAVVLSAYWAALVEVSDPEAADEEALAPAVEVVAAGPDPGWR